MNTKNLPRAIELAHEWHQADNEVLQHSEQKVADDIRMNIIRQLGTHPTNHARFMQSLVERGSPRDVQLYYIVTTALEAGHDASLKHVAQRIQSRKAPD